MRFWRAAAPACVLEVVYAIVFVLVDTGWYPDILLMGVVGGLYMGICGVGVSAGLFHIVNRLARGGEWVRPMISLLSVLLSPAVYLVLIAFTVRNWESDATPNLILWWFLWTGPVVALSGMIFGAGAWQRGIAH